MWCKLMKKWKGAQQGNVLHVCREHLKPDESCPNISEGVSEQMAGGETIGGRATLADSILKVITELVPLTEDCLRECIKPLCMIIQSASPKLDFVTAVSVLCYLRGTGQSKDEYLSITPHSLSSSERCIFLLISTTCQKLGEQLLSWTATLLILDT